MEGIITLLIIGLVLIFGSQLLKGVGNIFSVFGRVAGWIIGVVIILLVLKSLFF
jgi:hypothetical protein